MRLRLFKPLPFLYVFYEGREDDTSFGREPSWVDDGALSLGIASYAIVDGAAALIYDTHVSPERGQFIRQALQDDGVEDFTVVYSHWHLDHVAGARAFADSPIIANVLTAQHLSDKQTAIEAGTLEGPPAILPLQRPTQSFKGTSKLAIGAIIVVLIQFNIHSDDATVVWLPDHKILLAGDTLEDTITYVGEPNHLSTHVQELDRLWQLQPEKIFPAHGDPDILAAGGYDKTLIRANQQYIRTLLRMTHDEILRSIPLADLIAGPLQMGWVYLFAPYEAVHQQNMARLLKATSN